jgi:hypothetical protein
VREILLSADKFPWFLQRGTSWAEDAETAYLSEWDDGIQLVHTFVMDGSINSAYMGPLLDAMQWPRILAACSAPERISRMKANLMLRDSGCSTHNAPHVDLGVDHTVILYYVNDSDGDTVIFDRTRETGMDRGASIIQRESPRAGDFLVFDGRHYHASSAPRESKRRAVINFTLLP